MQRWTPPVGLLQADASFTPDPPPRSLCSASGLDLLLCFDRTPLSLRAALPRPTPPPCPSRTLARTPGPPLSAACVGPRPVPAARAGPAPGPPSPRLPVCRVCRAHTRARPLLLLVRALPAPRT